ncbi:catalase [Methylobacillus sp. MM3]|uniref:catalase family peroxidase n=1 Tax=Methylobacillus sp. MM3 TaxID=1848039 RepID=UPI0007E2A53C|nr:catalase family peroxidase [Methylobacillus sp. MM3]OAJ69905.1 catalase [Methylobacillus sp. MM3]
MKQQQIKNITRLIATALLLGSVGVTAADEATTAKPVTEQLVDTMTKLANGPYKGFRANHAKGIMAEGTFTPSAEAAGISKAPHLQGVATPVLVRFSNATGVPTIADANGNAMPKGMAIRFTLPDGSSTDIVAISVNGFPAATPEDFLGLLNAVAASGPDVASPKPVEQFLASHPAAMKFVSTPKPAPVSFATQPFFGVNAFQFTNAKGETQYGRYRIVPIAGAQFLTDAEAAKQAPNYLMDELPVRLGKQEAQYRIVLQLAEAGDSVDDPTAIWPDDRKQVELGVLTIKSAVANSQEAERSLMFNPLVLPDGIAPSNDPVLLARPGAYAVSYGRRLAN